MTVAGLFFQAEPTLDDLTSLTEDELVAELAKSEAFRELTAHVNPDDFDLTRDSSRIDSFGHSRLHLMWSHEDDVGRFIYYYLVASDRIGFPFRFLQGEQCSKGAFPLRAGDKLGAAVVSWHGAVPWPDWAFGSDWQGVPGLKIVEPRAVPLRVRAGALIANIVFFELCCVVILRSAVHPIRRRIRRWRGRCPRCRYDLQGAFDDGCPECGWNRPAGLETADGCHETSASSNQLRLDEPVESTRIDMARYEHDAFRHFSKSVVSISTPHRRKDPRLSAAISVVEQGDALRAVVESLDTELAADSTSLRITIGGQTSEYFWRDRHRPGFRGLHIHALFHCPRRWALQITEQSFGPATGSLATVRAPGIILILLHDALMYCQPSPESMAEQH